MGNCSRIITSRPLTLMMAFTGPGGTVAIDFRDVKETNIARPAVLKHQGKYKMWFCYSYD